MFKFKLIVLAMILSMAWACNSKIKTIVIKAHPTPEITWTITK